MTKFSDVLAAGVTIRESANDGSDFTNPSADYRRLFLGEDGLLHVKDSAGSVTSPYTGSSAASGCRVTHSTNQALNNGSLTVLTFDTERWDDAAYHSGGSPTRLTVPATGRFMIGGHVQITINAGDPAYCFLRLSGSTIIAVQSYGKDVNEAGYVGITTVWDCTGGTEYFELCVLVSAGSKNAIAASSFSPEFWIERLGDT